MITRCAICQIPAQKLICAGCRTLIKMPIYGCQYCAKPIANSDNTVICSECRSQQPSFDGIVCAGIYQPPASEWVMGLKFSKQLHWSRAMAELLTPMVNRLPHEWPLIAMPLHRRRLRHRGYNQAHELTKILAKKTGRIEVRNLLQRAKYTAMQATLPEKKRRANVRNAFAVRGDDIPKELILVDDVLTTGQTLSAAANALKKAGAETIYGAVFLRSEG